MIFDPQQRESLVELISIAFGRAAASLSDLTGQRVILNQPKVELYPLDELYTVFDCFSNGEVAAVNQIFSGSVAGNALL
ncbi:MAG: chemotaxis protein CheC, partial [Acidobacteriota bacterium]